MPIPYQTLCNLISQPEPYLPALTAAEWSEIARLAVEGGVGPLLYARLQELAPGAIPAPALEALRQTYYQSAGYTGLLRAELARLLAAFEEQHIPVIVLKGAALGQMLYPQPALRPMGDLDLLVRRADLPRAAVVAAQLGYFDPGATLLKPGSDLDRRTNIHIKLVGPRRTALELHWNVVGVDGDRRAPDPATLWAETRPFHMSAGGPQALCLAPEMLLVYLCGHIALQHGLASARLIWLYDVHRLLCGAQAGEGPPALDEHKALDLAQRLGWETALAAVLARVAALFGSPLPPAFLAFAGSDPFSSAGSLAEMVAQRAENGKSPYLDAWQRIVDLPAGVRLRLLFARLFPRKEYILHRYHPRYPGLWALYYPYRLLDISLHFLKSLWHRPRQESQSRQ